MVIGLPKKWQLPQRRKDNYSFLEHIRLLSSLINSLMTENINLLHKKHIVHSKAQNKCFWFNSYYKLNMLNKEKFNAYKFKMQEYFKVANKSLNINKEQLKYK